MGILFAAGAVVCCFLAAHLMLNMEKVRKNRYLRAKNPEEQIEGIQLSPERIRLLSVLIAAVSALAAWRLTATMHDPLNLLKALCSLVILCACGCVDYIEHRIPNCLTALLALLAAVLLGAGFLSGQEGTFGYLNSGIFAAVVSGVVLTAGSVLSHQGIGFGDVKLIAALGLMGGVYIVGGTLFFSVTLCAFASAFLLLTKKKTMKESVPFGPFLFIGYILTVSLLNV